MSSLRCFDCCLFRSEYDVDCLRHTPEHLRAGRESRIREAMAEARRLLDIYGRQGSA